MGNHRLKKTNVGIKNFSFCFALFRSWTTIRQILYEQNLVASETKFCNIFNIASFTCEENVVFYYMITL